MLTIGIILLIVGAVIGVATRGRDDAVRLIGVGVALLGAVLILLAVLPADSHAATAAVLFPFWRPRRRRRRPPIELEFARVLAAQVAIGTAKAPADPDFGLVGVVQQERRWAHAALGTIGIMLLQACKDDPVVQATLRMDIEIAQDANVTTLRRVG